MRNDIRDIINNYSLENKYADDHFFDLLFNELVTRYNLNNYVSRFDINNDNSNCVEASYDISKKVITINYLVLEEYIKDGTDNNFLSNNLYYYVNMSFLLAIMHELEHVKQLKLLSMNRDDLNSLLIKYGYSFVIPELRNDIYNKLSNYQITNLYIKTYYYNPIERMADINSLFNLLNIFSREFNLSDKVFNCFMNELYLVISSGYSRNIFNNIVSPCELFFNKINERNIWKNLDFYDFNRNKMLERVINSYSLEERLLFGLPLANEEIKNYSYKKIKRIVKN